MAIELQIQSAVLGEITARAVQAQLMKACFPALGETYIDHIDVGSAPVQLMGADAGVRMRLPLDVYLVKRKDLLATPNGVPAGATSPAGGVVAILEVSASGTSLAVRCVDVDLGALGSPLGPAGAAAARTLIVNALGAPIAKDFSTTWQQLGLPPPATSRAELFGSTVAIRFDPQGGASLHLFAGQEWGLYLDGTGVEQLARAKLAGLAATAGITVSPHWRPAGDAPHVDIDYAGSVPGVPDPFTVRVSGVVGCDFSLVPPPLHALRTTVHWSLDIDLGGSALDLLDSLLEGLAQKFIENAIGASGIGAVPIGDRAFTIDSSLPDTAFGGARFAYDSIHASASGMTLGGAVRRPIDPGKATLQPSVKAFGLPYYLEFCRQLAKTGSGVPSASVSLKQVWTYARVYLSDQGRYCGYEIVSPHAWIAAYIEPPGDSPEMRLAIPSAIALAITEPVRLLVRTARGVRLIDFGIPPRAQVDAQGHVTNALLDYVPDCLYLNREHGLQWAAAGGLFDETVVHPPLEQPNWSRYLGRQRGIEVQLVALHGLEAGELLRFRSADHGVDVTADREGRALVPVLLPLANRREAASLVRVNRRGIAGHFSVQSAAFVFQAGLAAGTQHQLVAKPDGGALLTSHFGRHLDVHEIGLFGVPVLLKQERLSVHADLHEGTALRVAAPAEEAGLNPQPLPPKERPVLSPDPVLVAKLGLPGVVSLLHVPGFAHVPLALARMADGETLLIDLADDGRAARVAGSFAGPVGGLEVAGDWAVNAVDGRLAIYRVVRDAEACGCAGR